MYLLFVYKGGGGLPRVRRIIIELLDGGSLWGFACMRSREILHIHYLAGA